MANKFHHNLRTAREAGMTLLETVISVGLAGVVLVAAANLPIIKKKALATAKSAGQLADLRANVRSTLSCKNTLSGANCNQKSQIIVPKKCDGTPMATESANAEIGNFTIRTSCGTDIGPNRILVEYSPAGKNSWKNLLGGIPLICDPTDATLGPQETVEVLNTNDPNVVTDIYFIVDNSFSMSVIQSKTATAVASLIDKLATFDMSVDLYLYTTTTLPPTLAFQKNSTLGVLDFYGNCNHYCGAKPALEMTNRQFNLFPGGQLVTGDPLNINYGDMVVSVPEYGLAPSQFPGSVLNIRRNMKKSEIDAVKNLAQDTIANLGVDGSDAEAPSAVLEAISEKYTGPSDHRFAALIVTNEDDLTGFVSPTYHYTGYSAAKRLILGHMRVPILSLTNVEYYNGGTYKDGVMVSPAYWAPHPYYAAEIDCSKVDCSGLSTTSEAVCSPEIKEAGKVLLVSTPYLRLSGEPDCKMRTSPSTIPLDGTTTATCDSYGRYSTTLTYREYFRFAYSTRLWDTPDCTIQEVPVRSLGGGGQCFRPTPFFRSPDER